jgi:RNA polymerase subunit RPABC4/transcription elongation factor Spt4
MAAFCTCCGAEITLKAEACPVCGMPRHGMVPSGQSFILDAQTNQSQEEVSIDPERRRHRHCQWD